MKNKIFCRVLFYAIGLLVLALGLTLNTKTGLGVSPIISVAYSISEIFDHNFGNMTLALYSVFVVIEMVLHLIRERRYSRAEGGVLANAGRKDLRLILLMDFLQIPLSIVFTRFLNVFSAVIPSLYSDGPASPGELAARVVFLIIAIILTGIGAAMSLDMRIVPNPGDGIVQAIADTVQFIISLLLIIAYADDASSGSRMTDASVWSTPSIARVLRYPLTSMSPREK